MPPSAGTFRQRIAALAICQPALPAETSRTRPGKARPDSARVTAASGRTAAIAARIMVSASFRSVEFMLPASAHRPGGGCLFCVSSCGTPFSQIDKRLRRCVRRRSCGDQPAPAPTRESISPSLYHRWGAEWAKDPPRRRSAPVNTGSYPVLKCILPVSHPFYKGETEKGTEGPGCLKQ